MTITDWHVVRSGGSLTVHGKSEATGEPVRLARISRVESRAGGGAVAVRKNGAVDDRFNLA